MSFSLNDLVLRTMLDLNIIEAEETPSNADYEFVKQTIQSEFARLEAGGMQFSNQSTTVDQIDPAMFTLLSSHMGFCIGPAFQVMSAATAQQSKQFTEGNMWTITNPVKFPQEMKIERAARGARIRDPIISQ